MPAPARFDATEARVTGVQRHDGAQGPQHDPEAPAERLPSAPASAPPLAQEDRGTRRGGRLRAAARVRAIVAGYGAATLALLLAGVDAAAASPPASRSSAAPTLRSGTAAWFATTLATTAPPATESDEVETAPDGDDVGPQDAAAELTAADPPRGEDLDPLAPIAPRHRVGPLWLSDKSRDRVRGDRPVTVHAAYVADAHDPEAAIRVALAEFESTVIADLEALPPKQTIPSEPPEDWMKALVLPELPVRWHAKTVAYLKWFKEDPKGRAMMRAWWVRKGRYEVTAREIFREVGVPEELVFVALAESGFNPTVKSYVGAAGLWQFMEPTGSVYGLEATYWVDDRHDFERSTWAAAAYLKDLQVRFGSWELALAAYNGGYGLVMQAVRRNNTNNFWALSEIENGLPFATRSYIPKIVAAAIVARNPKTFGLEGVQALPALDLVTVRVADKVKLADVATAIGEESKLLAELNAAYVRGQTPPEGGPHDVRIPKAKLAKFEAAAAKLAAGAQPYRSHVVRAGESLSVISARYGVSERKLRKINAIEDSAEVGRGVVLVVPRSPLEKIPAPERPLVAVPYLDAPKGQRIAFLEVTRALTPREVSDALAIPWERVLAWNDLDPQARLQDGQWLQVLVPDAFDAEAAKVLLWTPADVEWVVRGTEAHLEAELARRDLVRRGHKVKKGETLEKIGAKYGLTVGSLGRINDIPRDHTPAAGDVLVVYVTKAKVKSTVTPPTPKATTLTAELLAAASVVPVDPDAAGAVEGGDGSTPPRPAIHGASQDASKSPDRAAKGGKKRTKRTRRTASTSSSSKLPGE
jgi:membrane-bound lytic murein transglycosylase D